MKMAPAHQLLRTCIEEESAALPTYSLSDARARLFLFLSLFFLSVSTFPMLWYSGRINQINTIRMAASKNDPSRRWKPPTAAVAFTVTFPGEDGRNPGTVVRIAGRRPLPSYWPSATGGTRWSRSHVPSASGASAGRVASHLKLRVDHQLENASPVECYWNCHENLPGKWMEILMEYVDC